MISIEITKNNLINNIYMCLLSPIYVVSFFRKIKLFLLNSINAQRILKIRWAYYILKNMDLSIMNSLQIYLFRLVYIDFRIIEIYHL